MINGQNMSGEKTRNLTLAKLFQAMTSRTRCRQDYQTNY